VFLVVLVIGAAWYRQIQSPFRRQQSSVPGNSSVNWISLEKTVNSDFYTRGFDSDICERFRGIYADVTQKFGWISNEAEYPDVKLKPDEYDLMMRMRDQYP